jgi:hypothetical protein
MAKNGSSAEHELLKAIEGKTDFVPLEKTKVSETRDRMFHLLEDLKKNFSKMDLKGNLTLADANKVMVGVVGLLFFAQAVSMVNGGIRMSSIPKFDASAASLGIGEPRVVSSPLKESSYYFDALLGRNIFLEKETAVVVDDSDVRKESAPDISKELRLTGLSWLEETGEKFAMIEDVASAITYYLQEGDKIKSFTVEDIGKNKVVLRKDDMEIELR